MNFMRGSKERWEELNPILEDGQPGFERPNENSESSEYKLKIGDGIHHWNDLPYIGGSGSDPGLYELIQLMFETLDANDDSLSGQITDLAHDMDECCEETHDKLDEIIRILHTGDNFQVFLDACAAELNRKGYPVAHPTKDEVYAALLTIAYSPIIHVMLDPDSITIQNNIQFIDTTSDRYFININDYTLNEEMSITDNLSFDDTATAVLVN